MKIDNESNTDLLGLLRVTCSTERYSSFTDHPIERDRGHWYLILLRQGSHLLEQWIQLLPRQGTAKSACISGVQTAEVDSISPSALRGRVGRTVLARQSTHRQW